VSVFGTGGLSIPTGKEKRKVKVEKKSEARSLRCHTPQNGT
jgi:hypothetical protein